MCATVEQLVCGMETSEKCWKLSYDCVCVCVCRVIDVGSEWRTFSNEKSSVDRSRVGGAEVGDVCVFCSLLLGNPNLKTHSRSTSTQGDQQVARVGRLATD